MATASLKIRLNCNQVLELARQLSDEDKLELNRGLAVEARSIKLRRLLETLKTDEISQKEIDDEGEAVRQEAYEMRLRNENTSIVYDNFEDYYAIVIGEK